MLRPLVQRWSGPPVWPAARQRRPEGTSCGLAAVPAFAPRVQCCADACGEQRSGCRGLHARLQHARLRQRVTGARAHRAAEQSNLRGPADHRDNAGAVGGERSPCDGQQAGPRPAHRAAAICTAAINVRSATFQVLSVYSSTRG